MQGLELHNLMDFDTRTMPGDIAACDPLVDPSPGGGRPAPPCTYFNYDVANTPPRSDDVPCNQPNGIPFPELVTNMRAGQVMSHEIPGGRCGVSQFAFHLAAQNMAVCTNPATQRQGWGATVQIAFNPNAGNSGQSDMPVDLSAWDGIAFWVRQGDGPSGSTLLASVQDPYTAAKPPSYQCPDCLCSTADGIADALKCDAFGVATGLTPEWRLIKAPFARLQQKGFGRPSPLGHIDAEHVTGLQIGLSAGNWDVWIDDISVYRETQ